MAHMAAYELQRAIFAKLSATSALVTRLGGARIYDDVPLKPDYPFISFGAHVEKDWSTGSERGSEHTVLVHVWSLAKSREEVTTLMELARNSIAEMPAPLTGHRLVSIRHEQSDIEREDTASRLKGTIRFRALIEPL